MWNLSNDNSHLYCDDMKLMSEWIIVVENGLWKYGVLADLIKLLPALEDTEQDSSVIKHGGQYNHNPFIIIW